MLTAGTQLELNRCPHCGVNIPNLRKKTGFKTNSTTGEGERTWTFYACQRCGGIVTTSSRKSNSKIFEYFPTAQTVDESIPKRAANFLSQALESLHAPSGAIMLAASSVDAMLKKRDIKLKAFIQELTKRLKII